MPRGKKQNRTLVYRLNNKKGHKAGDDHRYTLDNEASGCTPWKDPRTDKSYDNVITWTAPSGMELRQTLSKNVYSAVNVGPEIRITSKLEPITIPDPAPAPEAPVMDIEAITRAVLEAMARQ